jgi:glyoxylase-like metal-dependent hydrolase (beta-lactamase superfamily II)
MRTATSRRQLLKTAAALGGSALVARALPASLGSVLAQAAAPDPLAAMRRQMGAAPIEMTPLSKTLTMLSGPGGNILVLHGPDGKVVVDSFVQPAWPRLKETLDGIGSAPLALLVDTHWHFDHADNNGQFRRAGAIIVAHENTRTRLSQTHELLGMHLDPAPAAALPTETFAASHQLHANGETIDLGHVPAAHTDTDIYVRYARANVLHLGDVYFAGMYPFIDAGTGGRIDGMIEGASLGLKMADAATRIVPGHGPLTDRAGLTRYRDMLVDVRDRVRKLKAEGRTLGETVAARPTADLDPTWGQGVLTPDDFVAIVYRTL